MTAWIIWVTVTFPYINSYLDCRQPNFCNAFTSAHHITSQDIVLRLIIIKLPPAVHQWLRDLTDQSWRDQLWHSLHAAVSTDVSIRENNCSPNKLLALCHVLANQIPAITVPTRQALEFDQSECQHSLTNEEMWLLCGEPYQWSLQCHSNASVGMSSSAFPTWCQARVMIS